MLADSYVGPHVLQGNVWKHKIAKTQMLYSMAECLTTTMCCISPGQKKDLTDRLIPVITGLGFRKCPQHITDAEYLELR